MIRLVWNPWRLQRPLVFFFWENLQTIQRIRQGTPPLHSRVAPRGYSGATQTLAASSNPASTPPAAAATYAGNRSKRPPSIQAPGLPPHPPPRSTPWRVVAGVASSTTTRSHFAHPCQTSACPRGRRIWARHRHASHTAAPAARAARARPSSSSCLRPVLWPPPWRSPS